jgi:hypothetical protein
MVFRLLDAGKIPAAADLVAIHADAADAAFWADIAGPSTGALSLVTAAVSR